MRILLVSQEYPPETGWGGIGTYLGLHAPALAAAGHEVHVLSAVRDQGQSDESREGVAIHRRDLTRAVRGPGRIARQSWSRLELANAVRRQVRALGPADVTEAPDWMAEALMLRARPLVLRLHSSAAQVFPHVGRSGPDARLAIALERAAMRRADLLIGSGVQVAAMARERRMPARVEIPYPVPLRDARAAWTAGPPRIVFAGRFEPRKGPDLLVEALPGVLEQAPEAMLVLVGRDTTTSDGRSVLEALLRRARGLGVVDAIEVVERWGSDAVEEALEGAAVCAAPSRWESFGYVAAEALAGGTPTVVSGWPSLAEIVGAGAGGTIVTEERGRAWSEALGAAITDPAAARSVAEEGRSLLQRLASPAVVAERTVAAYELAASEAQRHR